MKRQGNNFRMVALRVPTFVASRIEADWTHIVSWCRTDLRYYNSPFIRTEWLRVASNVELVIEVDTPKRLRNIQPSVKTHVELNNQSNVVFPLATEVSGRMNTACQIMNTPPPLPSATRHSRPCLLL